jgi:hypothetical protein
MIKSTFHFTYEFWRDWRFDTIKSYSIVIKPRLHTEKQNVKKFFIYQNSKFNGCPFTF